MYTNTTQFSVALPKDSASNVQTVQDGYSYCSSDRLLMASIDGGAEFAATMTSQTILFDSSTNSVYIAPLDISLVGDHTVDLWLILASYPTVQTNKNTVTFTIVDTCPISTLTLSE